MRRGCGRPIGSTLAAVPVTNRRFPVLYYVIMGVLLVGLIVLLLFLRKKGQ